MAKKAESTTLAQQASRSGRPAGARGIVVQLKPDGWKAFRQLAFDLDISVQDLGVEAFNDLMAKYGRKQKIESAWD
jgi:hypothetical protein